MQKKCRYCHKVMLNNTGSATDFGEQYCPTCMKDEYQQPILFCVCCKMILTHGNDNETVCEYCQELSQVG